MAIRPSMFKKPPYDPNTDFIPISHYLKSPFVLVVNPDLPIKSVPELIAYVKARPGKIAFSSTSIGGAPHLSGEYINQRFGVQMTHVPYKISPQAIQDVAAGHVQLTFAEAAASLPLIREGKLRALAVTSTTRLGTLPDVPPFAEASGIPDFEAVSWHMLFGRLGMPKEIVDRLHTEMTRIIATPELQTRMSSLGLIPYPPPPIAESQRYIKSEIDKWGGLVEEPRPRRDDLGYRPGTPLPSCRVARLTNAPKPPDCGGNRPVMATRPQPPEPRRPAPRLYLVAPSATDPARLADGIADALRAADVAAVLLPLAGDDERALLNGVKALAPAVQGAGAALLLDGRPDLVARAGADGAHLTGIDEFSAAVASLKPDRIAGCGGLATRHDAMLAAEVGRRLRDVRRAGRPRTPAVLRRRARAHRVVGRGVRDSLRRLRHASGRDRRAGHGRRRFRRGRRIRL